MPLRILISSLIVVFLNFPVGAFLNACNKQVVNTINMGIVVVINVILNLILIKEYSFNGAAISAFVSGFILFFLGLRWVGKIIDYDKIFLLKSLGKSLGASIVMAGLLYFSRDLLSIYISIPLSVIIYFSFLYLFKGISKDDIRILYRSIVKAFT